MQQKTDVERQIDAKDIRAVNGKKADNAFASVVCKCFLQADGLQESDTDTILAHPLTKWLQSEGRCVNAPQFDTSTFVAHSENRSQRCSERNPRLDEAAGYDSLQGIEKADDDLAFDFVLKCDWRGAPEEGHFEMRFYLAQCTNEYEHPTLGRCNGAGYTAIVSGSG